MKPILLLTLLFSANAFAQTAAPPAQAATTAAPVASGDAFASLDADKDGRVSSTESDADAGFSARFATMDANADGFVTRDEYHAQAKANAQPPSNR